MSMHCERFFVSWTTSLCDVPFFSDGEEECLLHQSPLAGEVSQYADSLLCKLVPEIHVEPAVVGLVAGLFYSPQEFLCSVRLEVCCVHAVVGTDEDSACDTSVEEVLREHSLVLFAHVLNMSDILGAYALTVNLAIDIFFHRACRGCLH